MMNNELHNFIGEQFQENFGSPSSTFRFQSEPNPIPDVFKDEESSPELLDVFMWYPDKSSDLTTFATCGSSQRVASKSSKRFELLWAFQGKLDSDTEKSMLEFLANVAIFPFQKGDEFNWWFSMEMTGDIPGFPGCNSIILHPPFHEKGWAVMHSDLFDKNLYNVVPLTAYEHNLKKEKGIQALQDFFFQKKVNIFAPR